MNTNPTYKPRDAEQTPQTTQNQQSSALVRRPKKSSQASRKTLRRKPRASPIQLNETSLPLFIQSPQVVADQFLSHFITFFAKVSARQVLFNSWMVTLPYLLAARSAVAEKSIIAASMVYAGRDSGNLSMVVESYKWYGSGIAKQREILEELRRETRVPTVEESKWLSKKKKNSLFGRIHTLYP